MPETVFQERAAKVAIDVFSQIKSFENTAFGHVTEVPTAGLFVKTIGRSWSEDSSQPNK